MSRAMKRAKEFLRPPCPGYKQGWVAKSMPKSKEAHIPTRI